MKFFDKNWHELGTEEKLEDVIAGFTGIPQGILSGKDPLEAASIA